MINTATIHLKEGGPININGFVSSTTTEDQLFVEVHSHDLTTGNCRDTLVPLANVVAVSVEYRD